MENEKKVGKEGGFANALIRVCDRFIPDSMVVAWILTIVVAVLAMIFAKSPLITSTEASTSIIDGWLGGFWSYLTLAMNMALLVLSGHVLSSAPVFKKVITKIASVPKNQAQAFLLLSVFSFISVFLHWGIGIMLVIVMARAISASSYVKGYKIHLPAFVALMYITLDSILGLTETLPLVAASEGYMQSMVPEEYQYGLKATYSLNETALNPTWIIASLIICAIVVVLLIVVAKRAEASGNIESVTEDIYKDFTGSDIETAEKPSIKSFANWANYSRIISAIVGVAMVVGAVKEISDLGIANIGYGTFNMLVFGLAIIAHKTPYEFAEAVKEGIGSTWSIVIQFPFYAGIYGIFVNTGLATVVSNFIISFATAEALPFITYIYTGIVTFFIPSTGSKAMLVFPTILPTAVQTGASISKILPAFGYSASTFNILMPFWCLPYCAMFKIEFKKIFPYLLIGFIINVVVQLLFITFIY